MLTELSLEKLHPVDRNKLNELEETSENFSIALSNHILDS